MRVCEAWLFQIMMFCISLESWPTGEKSYLKDASEWLIMICTLESDNTAPTQLVLIQPFALRSYKLNPLATQRKSTDSAKKAHIKPPADISAIFLPPFSLLFTSSFSLASPVS